MKQTKTILLTTLTVLFAFTGVVYTSCHKDPCAGVDCLNGGACSNGNCLCPSGYTGARCEDLAKTSVAYYNNTFTDVNITVDGVNYTIKAGDYLTLDGSYGDPATASAYTQGSGGLKLTWSFSDYFPASGTLEEDLDVSSDYFYLEVINNSPYTIGQIDVNHGLTSEIDDPITVPNDDNTYGIGYYNAYTNSNLYLISSGAGHTWSYNISLTGTQNQYYTFTAL